VNKLGLVGVHTKYQAVQLSHGPYLRLTIKVEHEKMSY